MIKKILVALDDDDSVQRIFNQTVELAHPLHANLHLLNVLMPERDDSVSQAPYSDRDWKMYKDRYREVKAASLKLLESWADTAKEAGIQAEVTQALGTPGPVICQLAKTWGADLIIVGSHGRKGLREMLLGSVSNYVVHHAPCSVMVVHEPA